MKIPTAIATISTTLVSRHLVHLATSHFKFSRSSHASVVTGSLSHCAGGAGPNVAVPKPAADKSPAGSRRHHATPPVPAMPHAAGNGGDVWLEVGRSTRKTSCDKPTASVIAHNADWAEDARFHAPAFQATPSRSGHSHGFSGYRACSNLPARYEFEADTLAGPTVSPEPAFALSTPGRISVVGGMRQAFSVPNALRYQSCLVTAKLRHILERRENQTGRRNLAIEFANARAA